jgi:prevent-host-death family protein
MALLVNMHEAKSTLSRLVEQVEAGTEVTIAKAGVPVARLVPVEHKERRLGLWTGKLSIAEDFDAPLPDAELRLWEGEGE